MFAVTRIDFKRDCCTVAEPWCVTRVCFQEVLYGRDLDVQPREEDFRSLRACAITAYDKELICASLQASAVAMRCIAAGLQSAENVLGRQDGHPRKLHQQGLDTNHAAKV